VFYAVFVVLAAIHGAIGVRSVAADWTHIHGSVLDAFMWVFAAFLVVLGFRAVAAVVLP
jgi:succinate dehydrogenase hydrophobic anchor subunit